MKGWAGLAVAAFVIGMALVLARAEVAGGSRTLGVVILAVGWAAVWTLAALGAGRPVVRWLTSGTECGWEDHVLAAIAGTGVLTACIGGLSVLGLFLPWPLMILVLLWAIVGLVSLARGSTARARIEAQTLPLLGIAAVALLVAATVSPFYDQWHQHLGFPWVWLQDGSIHPLPNNWYSYMPVNSSLLFACGLKILGPWSAQVVHWWAGVVTALAVAALARRAAGSSGSAATWAAWIIATTPTVLHLATTAGSDLFVAMFAGGAWLALIRTADGDDRSNRWWAFAGVCVGLAVGTKYTAIGTVAIPAVVGAVVLHRPWRGPRSFAPLVRGSATATVAGFAVFAPWAIRNLLATGNPLFPFFNQPFRGILRVPYESVERFAAWLSGFDLSLGHAIAGLDLGTFQAPLDGFPSIGLAYLGLVAVAVFSWRRLPGRAVPALVAGAVAGIAFWLASLHVDRYLLPALVPATAVLAAAVATTLEETPKRVRFGLVALIGLVFAWNLAASISQLGMERLGCTLGIVRLEPILARWVSSSPAFEPVAALPPDAKVLLVAESRALGFERSVELEHPFGEPRLEELARRSEDPLEMAERLAAEGITHVLTNRWEADRIARMQGRARYFETDDPETARRLDRFCRECLAPLWSDRGVFLYRLVPECSVPPPGAGNLAGW
ncbi:MAG: ArnT family glycosyltransferase [Thermoanaerobaculales bacterium]